MGVGLVIGEIILVVIVIGAYLPRKSERSS
jgi:hypothetical protein